jgi:hypothetical protein
MGEGKAKRMHEMTRQLRMTVVVAALLMVACFWPST